MVSFNHSSGFLAISHKKTIVRSGASLPFAFREWEDHRYDLEKVLLTDDDKVGVVLGFKDKDLKIYLVSTENIYRKTELKYPANNAPKYKYRGFGAGLYIGNDDRGERKLILIIGFPAALSIIRLDITMAVQSFLVNRFDLD